MTRLPVPPDLSHVPSFVEEWQEWACRSALTGRVYYGETAGECEGRLREADRVYVEHLRKNPNERKPQ